ncbi:receptor-like protein kinase FERONIA [Pyrus x bretschneideri]|uniref:receptor-like protein kinase FERONIA n=1 Tax=Pyrus x bretschneideri TaxID=225117 RepID=UPI0020306AB4|nr:receptor-like protein kinase FERONIA [Pyrus x bretschneideri]
MKPNLSHLFLTLFLQIITLHVAGDSPSVYKPVDDITLQCGFSGDEVNQRDGRTWSGDINSKFSPSQAAGSSSVLKAATPISSSSQVPYTTARLSRSEFTYTFPLTSGQKFIRLYFYPTFYAAEFDRSKSLFSVEAGGFTLLRDFNASVTADASWSETVSREFCLNIASEQSLNITFTPSRASPDAYAFINGIEIVSMPDNLYYTPPQSADGAVLVGSINPYPIENNTAMEMVYRINVGGSQLSFNQDTGMYRNWDGFQAEDNYLDALSKNFSVLPQNSSIELDFSEIPKYSAPEEVYRSGRSMGRNKTINKSYNLTWEFPVDSTFYYFIRLHFCEFEGDVTLLRDRLFQIFIANQTAEPMADVIAWSGGNGKPVYKDYVVFVPAGAGSKKKVHLFLALQTTPKDLLTNYNDAILNGLEIFKLSDSKRNLAGPNPDPPLKIAPAESPKVSDKKSIPLLAVIAGVVSGVFVLASLVGFLVFRRGRKVKDSSSRQGTKWGPFSFSTTKSTKTRGSSLPSDLCRYFSLAEIKIATQNFNQSFIVGVGGFGHVYKGHIDDGATHVAIKRLKTESSQGAREFKTEIELLSQLRHRNLVSLIGCCTDKNEMILVYDYMSRGTLADHLYHTNNPPLSWGQRLQICIGAARGLCYLHSEAQRTIIHRDVKSTNILLDEKWVAKVSDFGLSKMGTTTMSKAHISTVVKGSFGYLDPEYYRRQQLTVKSDVYSFGVVLCEVLCARPAVVHAAETRQMNLAKWTKSCHHDGELDQIIDPNMKGKIETECLNKYVEIAMSCINDSGMERPSMNDVVKGLEFALQQHQNCGEKNNKDAFVSVPGYATNESVQCISETIFSEINDPNGR